MSLNRKFGDWLKHRIRVLSFVTTKKDRFQTCLSSAVIGAEAYDYFGDCCTVQVSAHGFQQQSRYLFIVKPPRWINRHDQTGHNTNEHSIKGRAYCHTAQGKPEFSKSLRRVAPVTDTEHVGHGIEQSPAVLFSRRPILKDKDKTVTSNGNWEHKQRRRQRIRKKGTETVKKQ